MDDMDHDGGGGGGGGGGGDDMDHENANEARLAARWLRKTGANS